MIRDYLKSALQCAPMEQIHKHRKRSGHEASHHNTHFGYLHHLAFVLIPSAHPLHSTRHPEQDNSPLLGLNTLEFFLVLEFIPVLLHPPSAPCTATSSQTSRTLATRNALHQTSTAWQTGSHESYCNTRLIQGNQQHPKT